MDTPEGFKVEMRNRLTITPGFCLRGTSLTRRTRGTLACE